MKILHLITLTIKWSMYKKILCFQVEKVVPFKMLLCYVYLKHNNKKQQQNKKHRNVLRK